MSMEKTYASIITIGDELLIGQVVDTNSAWLAQELNSIGIAVKHRVSVGDVWDEIWGALDGESKCADIILITGGLGPTADDITKPLLCKYFGGKMVMHQPTLDHVTYLMEKVFHRPMPMLERNIKQAEVPDVCTVLFNERGTAPGMLFEKDGKIFVSMPGVPHEMKYIFSTHAASIIQQKFKTGFIAHRTLLTAGVGESYLAEKIQGYEKQIPANIKLAYLPNYGMVRLRLTGSSFDESGLENQINHQFNLLKKEVEDFLVVDEDIPMEHALGKLLLAKNKSISTAESCTGGLIASLIASIAGASAYFKGSVVSYANEVKKNVLHVADSTLQTVGAVSEETVIQMAGHVAGIMQTDYAIAVSGIMGPSGGTNEKPVGTVWIAVTNTKKTVTQKFNFRFDRDRNIKLTATNALLMALKFIKQDNG